VVGQTRLGSAEPDIFTLKYTLLGTIAWSNVRGSNTAEPDRATQVAVDSSGNPVVLGSMGSGSAGQRISIAKLSATNGSVMWARLLGVSGGLSNDTPIDLAVHSSNDVMVLGQLGAYRCAILYRLQASDGAGVWQTTWAENTYARSLAISPTGTLLVCGSARNVNGAQEVTVTKLRSTTGSILWSTQLTETYLADGPRKCIATDAAGDVYVLGNDLYYQRNLRTVKLSGGAGASMWQMDYLPAPYAIARALALAVDENGDVVVLGRLENYSVEMSWATVKYTQP
jgi:outer membrane protein assembly factor BamB